ncbi:MAG: hypothetical protein QOK04_2316 [Solirubrobacteraceae bacterium]|jgi:hypothetical protein|nr:hypothetical protein [Solirubrobacteraceae bacterium]
MRRVGTRRWCVAACIAVAAAPALSACGGGGSKKTASTPAPNLSPAKFPRGSSLQAIAANLPQGPILAPGSSVLRPGTNRFAFGLFDAARKQIAGVPVALYVASASGMNARGPFLARSESLTVKPQFQSQTNAQDPNAAKQVYLATLPLGAARAQVVMAVANLDGRMVVSTPTPLQVGPGRAPPQVGAPAIKVHTPTSPPSPIASIDTRVPPDSMHDVDFASVLGRKPVLLVFATPALCMSRTCGPIVDEAEQLKATYGSRIAFIHMEIYKNNDIRQGYRPQFLAWHLPTEPWVFAIDRRGRIAAELEGPASTSEIQQAIEKALKT